MKTFSLICLALFVLFYENDYERTQIKIQNLKLMIFKQDKIIAKQNAAINLQSKIILKYSDLVDERLDEISSSYGCEQYKM
jgi:hypothetical protein